eukprot:CAMPEP_0198555400 /NCGR_PEP_ID=MMETSP1462-20131121/84658_1 /TAXON_ID=1333877 /ORGANISM="Brandtodinium nutriculum, Strain RCC3387" /LENGTH=126 /DNA_ID=CAMNT_0044286125 /DNA_START=346 /DNA_END=726 /DNA_ORIENTATION=+
MTVCLAAKFDDFTNSACTGRPVFLALSATRDLATGRSVSTMMTMIFKSSRMQPMDDALTWSTAFFASTLARAQSLTDVSLPLNVLSKTNGFDHCKQRRIIHMFNLLASGCVNSTACIFLVFPSSSM